MIQVHPIDLTWAQPSIAGGDSAESTRIKHATGQRPKDVLDASRSASAAQTSLLANAIAPRGRVIGVAGILPPQLSTAHGLSTPTGRASRRDVDAAKLARRRVQAVEEDHCDGEGQRRER